MQKRKNKNTGTHCSTSIINSAMYQLVMCRFLEFFADIMYIPSGAVNPMKSFSVNQSDNKQCI